MNINTLHWLSFKKENLPEALYGKITSKKKTRLKVPLVNVNKGMVALGYSKEKRLTSYTPPSLIVFNKKYSAEIFSWLNVYAAETAPLSQFTRIISQDDLELLTKIKSNNITSQREDCWASIIVGESLAQSANNIDLSNMPLSRTASCFTTSVAKSAILHGYGQATQKCIDRLKKIENDTKFHKKLVTTNDLEPVWKLIESNENKSFNVDDAVKLVLATVFKNKNINNNIITPLARGLDLFKNLYSDSVEERVVEFHQLVNELQIISESDLQKNEVEAIIASAAFLVGRGTTHAFLLNSFITNYPSTFIWFGILAALTGPEYWDSDWSRSTKGAERFLRTTLDWSEPSISDLSWIEYSWLTQAFEGEKGFDGFPKLLSNLISIEIIPGVVCQFRLRQKDQPHVQVAEINNNEELLMLLTHLETMTSRAKSLLNKDISKGQQSLKFDK